MASTLSQASFRGVTFGVTSTSNQSGRRTVTHEYPGLDTPYIEDMGRRAKTFSIEAFVVSNDLKALIPTTYQAQRDSLVAALETLGPGTLVHPYLGTMSVQVTDFSWSETMENGGMASFSITFAMTSSVVYPIAQSLPSATTQTNATAVNAASTAAIVNVWNLGDDYAGGGEPEEGTNPTQITAAATETLTDTATITVNALKSAISTQTSNLAAFVAAANNYALQATSLITNPASMAAGYLTLLENLTTAADPLAAVTAYTRCFSDIYDYFENKIYGASVSAQMSQSNDQIFGQVMMFGCIAAASSLAVGASFQSIQQAQQVVSLLDSAINSLIYQVTDDGLFQALNDLQVATDSAIPPPGQDLPSVVNVAVPFSVPSLVFCYNVYGDTSEELDIVAMNGISNPFCIPGNSTVATLQG